MLKNELKTSINDIGFINYIETETEKQKTSSGKKEPRQRGNEEKK